MSDQDEYSAEEPKLYEERQRGDLATSIIENPLWKEAFEDIEERFVEWLKHGSDEETLDAKKNLRMVEELKSSFEHHFNTGRMAAVRLGVIATAREAILRRFAA